MTILNESGVPDVRPPLQAANGLAERVRDVLMVVVGTRAEAFVAGSLPADVPRNPRVVFAVLEPERAPEQGVLASRVVEAAAGFRGLRAVLLLSGRSAELWGLDAGFEARLASRRLDLPVKAVDTNPEQSFCLSTDLEDRVVAALVEVSPKGTPDLVEALSSASRRSKLLGGFLSRSREESRFGHVRPVVLLGASPEVEGELSAELARVGVGVTGSVPGSGDLPAIDENAVVAVADPYLSWSARVAGERGARVVTTLMPIGVNGTARFVRDVASAAGSEAGELGRSRELWEQLAFLRNRVRGKRIFFAGDTGLEVSLARFLIDAGAVVLEVGVPRLDRKFLSEELKALGGDVDVVESPDWRGQMRRIDEARPDLVICSPGLYVPLVSRGHLCRSSEDLLAAGVHGYDGARRVLELIIRTFERAEALDAVEL